MEVDVLTPRSAFRAVSGYESRKRARSPSSPSPAERSSKRQLAVHPQCQGVITDGFNSTFTAPQAVAMHPMRKSEDEWVDQTRELTIESPALGGGACVFGTSVPQDAMAMEVSMREDIPMSNSNQTDTSILATQPIPQPFVDDHGSFTPQYASPLVQPVQLPSSTDFPVSSHPRGIPMQRPPSPHVGDQTIVIDTDDNDDLDAPKTQANTDVFPPRRKVITHGGEVIPRRVAMGYRANCEKCRQKVPGHWMHFIGEEEDDWL